MSRCRSSGSTLNNRGLSRNMRWFVARLEHRQQRNVFLVKEQPSNAVRTQKVQEPDIPPKKPDIQPEPRPEEIPPDKDLPEQEVPPMQWRCAESDLDGRFSMN